MDKFTKYVLLIMAVSIFGMVAATYIGVFVFGGDMETKYITMIEEHAEELGVSFWHPVELSEEGEYLAFTLAGAVAGFVIGYLIPPLFEKPKSAEEGKAS
ncbi:MAG: hypothetical protein N3F10_02855 [Candidatus Bathyarchaeota archaeon]|nr:hypothetical protein [Candidatus Bathyarchaeota archaeon]MCX8177222.1 hypothetical protein [Candidatus Bathyarchaeota archaeon]MDW8193535.1 hypothetical protein [Nitrososphaerota archaeon]